MIIVYAPEKSPRLDYIFTRIFSDILGCPYFFTTDKNEYIHSPLPSVNYSNENIKKGLWILPSTLLYSTHTNELDISLGKRWKGWPVFFSQPDGDIPFDIFSASFYLITRYEEYNSTVLDKHGRYDFHDSIIYQMGCIEEPIVERWAYALKEEVQSRYPKLVFTPKKFQFIPTIDIDHPYLYRNKGFVITTLCLLRDLVKGKTKVFAARLKTVLYIKEDIYFNFDSILDLYKSANIKTLFFAHCGPYGKYDRRYIYPSLRFKKELRKIAQKFPVYIHPSYISAFNKQQLIKEKIHLEQVLREKIESSRQHYLRFRFPETFRNLCDLGIRNDYSLMYPSQIGFRAGTCTPFPFYDLEKEKVTDLILHPVAIMDVTLKNIHRLTPSEALKKIKELAEKVKEVNGEFITLFHNSSLAETKEWKGWKEVYKEIINI